MTVALADLVEELANIFLYLTALAEMNGVDLGSEVSRKIKKNTRLSLCASVGE